MHISVTDAKGQLTDLVRRAEAGDEIILTRHGHPAVRLVPVRSMRDPRTRRMLLDAVRKSGAARATPGPDAARSQDFLYGADGLPEWSTHMIAVDTSALMAIVLGEEPADACMAILEAEPDVVISAGTVAEALIVAARRNVADEMLKLIDGLGFDVVTVTAASAQRIAAAYDRWGKGIHRAGLNFGDCFAYEVAQSRDCRLLYVGDDFMKTDVKGVL